MTSTSFLIKIAKVNTFKAKLNWMLKIAQRKEAEQMLKESGFFDNSATAAKGAAKKGAEKGLIRRAVGYTAGKAFGPGLSFYLSSGSKGVGLNKHIPNSWY